MRSYKKDHGAGAGSISNSGQIPLHEFGFTCPAAVFQRSFQIRWELRLGGDKVMKVVAQVLSTSLAAMSIENGEELDLELRLLLTIRL